MEGLKGVQKVVNSVVKKAERTVAMMVVLREVQLVALTVVPKAGATVAN